MALLDDTKMENLFRNISGDGHLLVKGSCTIHVATELSVLCWKTVKFKSGPD